MAGGQERILKGRISSMQATKKITRAMELIAASRIVKAQQRVSAAVPYSDQITEVVRDLGAAGASAESPLLAGRDELRTKCYVVITADRGLCGAYNANVQRAAEGEVKADVKNGLGYEIIPVGKRSESYFKFREYELGQAFQGFSESPSYDDARRIGEHVTQLFVDGAVDSVELIYTRFISAGSQEVVLRPLVPLSRETAAGGDGKAGSTDGSGGDYEFEPDPTTILETLLPKYIEARVYAALLNAAASEHAFRQRAMKSATDNAEELIKQLSIIMNRARQDSITTEIMEIVGGAEALAGDGDDDHHAIGVHLDDGDWGADEQPAPTTTPTGDVVGAVSEPAVADAAGNQAGPGGAATATATIEQSEPQHYAAPVTDANPLGLALAPEGTSPDDLKLVSGIGPVLEAALHDLGITTYRQIALWNAAEIDRVDDYLDFPGRIEREDWIAQARQLHRDHHGEAL